MRKILIGLCIFLLLACSLGNSNTPKQKVEELLDKYKNQNQEVLADLEDSIPDDYTGEYRSRYKEIMTNQYKNMEYKIINESIEGNEAVVDAEITVYDYSSVMNNASEYLKDHIEEFKKDAQELTDEITDNDYDQDKYNEYRLKKLEEATDKVNYTIEFNLTKKDKKWVIEPLSDSDIQKLHGLYEE